MKQQKEIETICKRNLELELSDADIKRLAEKAGSCGLTVAELLQNFIGDLVCGTYSNGSDERMYAQQWFDRCGFASFSDKTFLRYLVDTGNVDDALELWYNMQMGKEDIACMEAHPEENKSDEILAIQEDVAYWQEQLDYYWQEYTGQKKKYKHGTFNEEMKKVLEWWQEYQRILQR